MVERPELSLCPTAVCKRCRRMRYVGCFIFWQPQPPDAYRRLSKRFCNWLVRYADFDFDKGVIWEYRGEGVRLEGSRRFGMPLPVTSRAVNGRQRDGRSAFISDIDVIEAQSFRRRFLFNKARRQERFGASQSKRLWRLAVLTRRYTNSFCDR